MPHPVKPSSWSFRPRSTLKRPVISNLICAVISEWTWVESALVGLVGNALGETRRLNSGGLEFNTNKTICELMRVAENIRARLRILEITIGPIVKGTGIERDWISFVETLKKRAKERNRLAHAQWALSDDFPNDLIEMRTGSHELIRWTEKDVEACLARIIDVREQAHKMLIKIIDGLHEGHLPQGHFGPRIIS